jgi:hypothetical protein
MPDSPQPITTTGDAALTSAGISSRHVIARLSAPVNCMSSNIIAASRPTTGLHARNAIISCSSSSDSGTGSQPPSRYAAITGTERRRMSACSSAVSPH